MPPLTNRNRAKSTMSITLQTVDGETVTFDVSDVIGCLEVNSRVGDFLWFNTRGGTYVTAEDPVYTPREVEGVAHAKR